MEGVCTNTSVLAPGFSLGGAFPLGGFYPGVTLPLLLPLLGVLKEKLSPGSRGRAASSCQSCSAAGPSLGSRGSLPADPTARGWGC